MSTGHQYTRLVFITLVTLAIPGLCQAAPGAGRTIKCWKNDLGIRECGSIVPPEYAQKRIEVINERGIVVQVIDPPKTREQLEQERQVEEKRKAEEQAKKEQAHQDAILLNSYATERDLIIARDTNLKAIQGQLDIAINNLKMLQNNLDDLQSQAGNYERSGKKPPANLIEHIRTTKMQITKKQEAIQKRQQEKDALAEHYESQLARYRKLKGIKPGLDTQPAASTAGPTAPAGTR